MKNLDKVIFTGKSNSWDFDDSIGKHYETSDGLKIGETYVISSISHGDYSAHILLKGYEYKWFSTSFFELVK